MLYYDIINLVNCKTDLIFIACSQRPHYIESSVIFSVVSFKIASLNIVTGPLLLSLYIEILSAFVWLCCYVGLIFIETFFAYAIAEEALLI